MKNCDEFSDSYMLEMVTSIDDVVKHNWITNTSATILEIWWGVFSYISQGFDLEHIPDFLIRPNTHILFAFFRFLLVTFIHL